jgi:hypothetical protein
VPVLRFHARLARTCARAGLVLFCAACAANSLLAQGASSGCRPADANQTPQRLDYFRELVSSSNGDRQRVRTAAGLATASASKVALVTSNSTCLSAVSALNAKRNEPNTARQVWVVSLGGGDYAVEDPSIVPGGEFVPVYIFDRKFQFKAILYPW